MRAWALVAVASVMAVACNQSATPTASVSPRPTASPRAAPTNFVQVSPAPGLVASLGWDGVDNQMMLVSPVTNAVTRVVGLGVWRLTAGGWQPMAAPRVLADDRGFGPLTLAYDSNRRVEVLLSSTTSQPNTVVSEWDGGSWRQIAAGKAPHGTAVGAYSPELRALVAIEDGPPSQTRTWLYDGTQWRPAADAVLSSIYGVVAIAHDPTRHAIVALSGYTNASWQFDGSGWKQMELEPPIPAPSAAVAFNPNDGKWIVFGGSRGPQPLSETWIGNGNSWTELSPSTSPPPRVQLSGARFAWDPQRNQAILFGGFFYCCDLPYHDTWAWNGKTWTKLLDSPVLADPALLAGFEPCVAASSSYGLLIAAGKLEAIDTCGKVTASAPIAAPSEHACSAERQANLERPVSATSDKIFFRDGDTKIRSLSLDGQIDDVTSVPGGTTTVSFFSVSPDDKRIAVLVEDFSAAASVKLRLYVEDLHGAGHHVDIYTALVAKSGGKAIWPMGWHQSNLVLAVTAVCAQNPLTVSPTEWHVVDPATGLRKATIRGNSCLFGQWPSPSGVSCATFGYSTLTYDWTGKFTGSVQAGTDSNDAQSGLSPSGKRIFVSSAVWNTCNGQGTCVVFAPATPSDGEPHALADKRYGCLWIDEDHVLAPDSIIGAPSPQFPTMHYASVLELSAHGVCAGRFPGGL